MHPFDQFYIGKVCKLVSSERVNRNFLVNLDIQIMKVVQINKNLFCKFRYPHYWLFDGYAY